MSPTELKYRLIAQFGPLFYCDPDIYPVARVIDEKEFQRRFAEIENNSEAYQAILRHNGLAGGTILSPDQKQLVYGEYKRLSSIRFEPSGAGYQFNLRIAESPARAQAIEGLIDQNGAIQVSKREPTIATCPICLAGDTLIDTPAGAVPVRYLGVGMSVWSLDRTGARQPAVILKTAERPLPRGTSLVHIVLADGREVVASAGHPTFDGRRIGDLAVGDILDGARVVSAEIVPNEDGATYDLLPSGDTGLYWANGILLKSTLAP